TIMALPWSKKSSHVAPRMSRGGRNYPSSLIKKQAMNRIAATVFLIWIGLAWPAAGADKPLVVNLWPGKAPDETGSIGAEKIRMSPKLDRKQVEVTEPTRMVTNVTKPTLTIYRPAKDKDTGTAMLICPGGG